MAAPTLFAGSNTAAILAALTTAMRIENRVGSEEEARVGAPRRVTWVPVARGRAYTGPPTDARQDMKVAHLLDAAFDVHLWAKDFFDAEELEGLLVAGLFNTISPNAYALGPGDPRGGGAPEQQGYIFVVPVRLLRIPIPAEIRQRITLSTMTAKGNVTNPVGGDLEAHVTGLVSTT